MKLSILIITDHPLFFNSKLALINMECQFCMMARHLNVRILGLVHYILLVLFQIILIAVLLCSSIRALQ